MPPKSKKSSVMWKTCENCEAYITSKDHEVHAVNCPPNFKKWRSHFVFGGTLYSELNAKQGDDYNGLNPRWINDYVFLSQTVMQLCGFIIGDYVVMYLQDKNLWQVKRAWPCFEKSLTSVLVSQRVFDSLDLSSEQMNVTVSKMLSPPLPLEKICVKFLKEPEHDHLEDLKIFIKGLYTDKILQPIDKQIIQFFGKTYKFQILETKTYSIEEGLEDKISRINMKDKDVPVLYKVLRSTKWIYIKEMNENHAGINPLSISSVGGLDEVISELRDILSFALGLREGLAGFKMRAMRGVLLYGHTGCGKTLLARTIIQDSGARLMQITGPEIFSKFFGATESILKSAFLEAKQNAPSVILIDEIDILCPVRPSTDQERRVTSALLRCLDELQQDDAIYQSPVAIIATTSRPDNLDPAVRRAGRLETEVELSVPDAAARLDILKKLLSQSPNQCSREIITRIAKSAHGCTGADLAGLCSIAASQAVKRVAASTFNEMGNESKSLLDLGAGDFQSVKTVCITDFDLEFAASNMKPSAMREVAVEVPDVKWTDIGGQHDLKLKLKQAVEWPLTHPECFLRLGITPPRGVLMYGPPGCSKTMIAKALASESGLNFLSVKGPELFSQYVGESERAVRDLFRRARRVAPAIVFFDEIDALGTSRGSGQTAGSGSNVQERVLAQLLTELDGVAPLGNVTIVAATNRPDRLDKALLRPGRLDRIVYVPLPDLATRREIFSLCLSRMPASREIQVESLACLTEGYSGAEVRAVCNEAAMIALEQNMNAQQITCEHFESALIRVQPRTPKELLKLYEDYANEA